MNGENSIILCEGTEKSETKRETDAKRKEGRKASRMPKCAMEAILAPLRPMWVKVRAMGCGWWVDLGGSYGAGSSARLPETGKTNKRMLWKEENNNNNSNNRKTHKNKAAIRKGM